MNKQRGFTIIELIVVIAIIAVLAAIVLVNVTQYTAKGKDASIKGNMASMATIAAAFYDDKGTYIDDATTTTVDEDLGDYPAFDSGLTAIDDANGETKDAMVQIDTADAAPGDAFCVVAELNNGSDLWCVDSTGYKGAPAAYTDCSGDTNAATCAAGD